MRGIKTMNEIKPYWAVICKKVLEERGDPSLQFLSECKQCDYRKNEYCTYTLKTEVEKND
jgi:hypothetical protein